MSDMEDPDDDGIDGDVLSVSIEKVFFILLKAREFDAKEAQSDPDSGSNPSDDGGADILEDSGDDLTYAELMAALRDLNDDERYDLMALMWIGRGDFTAVEWEDARSQAVDLDPARVPEYLSETPLLSDYLSEALSALGYSVEDLEAEHL